MATVAANPRDPRHESDEARLQRLRVESKQINPEAIGSPEEIKRDALATFSSWSKLRRRARSARAFEELLPKRESIQISIQVKSGKRRIHLSRF